MQFRDIFADADDYEEKHKTISETQSMASNQTHLTFSS